MDSKNLLFIVRRLNFSRKNKGIVRIISLISLVGIAVVSLALVVILSVFNGFTSVAEKMLEKENPPILISANEGKTFDISVEKKLKSIADIGTIIPVVRQTVMISVGEYQSIVEMVGTNNNYFKFNPLDTSIVNGKSNFYGLEDDESLLGVNLAMDMGLNKGAEKMNIPIKITVPQNNDEAVIPEDLLKTEIVRYSACYATHSALDNDYIFVPISKARDILDYKETKVTNLYVVPKKVSQTKQIIKDIKKELGNKFSVKSLLEQQAIYFRIAKSEKIAVYIILSLIIFIATINIISTLIILYIQKNKMNYIFRAIGMTKKDIRKIYFNYGMMLNIVGCCIGVVLGVVFCILQEQFGLIKLAEGDFVVDAFSIKIMLWDIIRVVLIVLIIGMLSVKLVSSRIKID
mgnify:FL=1